MDRKQQEALSRKYSSDVWHFIRLSSGEYAIFNEGRNLVAVVESLAEAEKAYNTRTPLAPPKPKAPALTIDLEELGL